MLLMERRSVIDCMKDCLVPSRRWDGLSSSDDEAPSPAPTRASRAAEPGAAGSEERSRRAGSSRGGGKGGAFAALAVLRTAARTGCGAAVLWWLVGTPLRFLAEPPFAAAKVSLGVPSALLFSWYWLVRPYVSWFGPLSSYAALGCSLTALVGHCYVVSFPLAGSFAPMLGAFSRIIDGAFADLGAGVESMLARSAA